MAKPSVYEVAFRQSSEEQRSFGRTQVFLDRYTGEILTIRSPRDFTAADAFFAWQFPLHNGEAFGLLGRWLVFVIGLVPGLLYVTGFMMWWRRRRSRISRDRRSSRDHTTSDLRDEALGVPESCLISEATEHESEVTENLSRTAQQR